MSCAALYSVLQPPGVCRLRYTHLFQRPSIRDGYKILPSAFSSCPSTSSIPRHQCAPLAMRRSSFVSLSLLLTQLCCLAATLLAATAFLPLCCTCPSYLTRAPPPIFVSPPFLAPNRDDAHCDTPNRTARRQLAGETVRPLLSLTMATTNIRSPRNLYSGGGNAQPLGPLPTGWEQLWDPEVRQPFFIDHNTQTTTVSGTKRQGGHSQARAESQRRRKG